MILSRNVLNLILKHETLDEAERGFYCVGRSVSFTKFHLEGTTD